ncbi:unnamed protein product [Prorocentrum cordatum]|uniref:3'-5' exonuclease domain-containing protein n=1 Tax=Prorocentrum cordatum TaxID=2364126 RepID=A0ABN9WBM1_9DINO|nr:unnamed protein product [Polarella glacialis]
MTLDPHQGRVGRGRVCTLWSALCCLHAGGLWGSARRSEPQACPAALVKPLRARRLGSRAGLRYRRPRWWQDGLDDAGAGAQWLRSACGRLRKKVSVEEIGAYLSGLEAGVAKRIVRDTNENGKAPVHMAVQHRWSAEVPALIDVLVQHGAEVDVTTQRGFTPLLYAALRGHNESVRALLRHGASPRVVTVNGMTPARVGEGRLDPATLALLQRAEDRDARAWRDFREDPEARAAHARHQARLAREQQAAEEAEWWDGLAVEGRVASLALALREALDAGGGGASLALVRAAQRELQHARAGTPPAAVLSAALGEAVRGQPAALRSALVACREERLGVALRDLGKQDRSPLRLVLGALLRELAEYPGQLDAIPAAEIAELADRSMALEVLLLKRNLGPADAAPVEALWRDVLRSGADTDSFTPEVTSVVGLRLPRQQGGGMVAEWARLLHWACAMSGATAAWERMAGEVVDRAASAGRARQLLEAVTSPSPDLPEAVAARLELAEPVRDALRAAAAGAADAVAAWQAAGQRAAGQRTAASALPGYDPGVSWAWVQRDEPTVRAVHEELEAALQSGAGGRRVPVGVDTEWGRNCGRDGLSLVQLAVAGRAWVLDAAQPTPALRALVRSLLASDRALLLGFAFAQDMRRLRALARGSGAEPPPDARVVDLQAVAVARAPELRARLPGLKATAESWLGRTLDKSQQCSNWDARPLTASQLKYAVADAAVLLDIAAAMGILR